MENQYFAQQQSNLFGNEILQTPLKSGTTNSQKPANSANRVVLGDITSNINTHKLNQTPNSTLGKGKVLNNSVNTVNNNSLNSTMKAPSTVSTKKSSLLRKRKATAKTSLGFSILEDSYEGSLEPDTKTSKTSTQLSSHQNRHLNFFEKEESSLSKENNQVEDIEYMPPKQQIKEEIPTKVTVDGITLDVESHLEDVKLIQEIQFDVAVRTDEKPLMIQRRKRIDIQKMNSQTEDIVDDVDWAKTDYQTNYLL